jgi:hypothetical protein
VLKVLVNKEVPLFVIWREDLNFGKNFLLGRLARFL